MATPRALAPHPPIAVFNDTDLLLQAAAEGWPGTGSQADPIIIEGLSITGDAFPTCFYAQDLTLRVSVRGCHFATDGFEGNATALLNVSGMTFVDTSLQSYNALVGIGCSSITMDNCSLAGGFGVGGGESGYCVSFTDATDVVLNGSSLTQQVWSRAYFFNVYSLITSNNSIDHANLAIINCYGIDVTDNIFRDSETFGLYIWADASINVTRNQFLGGHTGILIYEDEGRFSEDISLSHNAFNNSGILFQAGPITLETMTSVGDTVNGRPLVIMKNVDLHGSTYSQEAGEYILLRVTNGTIANLDVDGADAVSLCACERLLLRDSSFSNISGVGIGLLMNRGVEIRSCSFVNISDAIWGYGLNKGTTIADCSFRGFVVAISDTDSEGTALWGNIFERAQTAAIEATTVWDCCIAGNAIADSDVHAIVIGISGVSAFSHNVTVKDNIISGCADGLFLTGVTDSVFVNNTIDHAGDIGIILYEANTDSSFSFNTIRWCASYSVMVMVPPGEGSLSNDRNMFFSNAFIGNNGAGPVYNATHRQVSDKEETNTSWAVTTDIGVQGNYWSDLIGPDANHDGFVDVPYEISHNVRDPRPFASEVPYEPTSVTGEPVNGRVRIAWDAPSFQGMRPIIEYEILRQDGESWAHVAFVTGNEYSDANVSAGLSYDYEVRAINEYGDGLASAPVTVRVPEIVTAAGVAMLLGAVTVAGLALTFVWTRRK